MASPRRLCSVCRSPGSREVKLQQCSRCHSRVYCGRQCQVSDWQTHRSTCGQLTIRPSGAVSAAPGSAQRKWYDKYRKCRDGHSHGGDLELITWECPQEEIGWGAVVLEEVDELKRWFMEDLGGNEERLYKKRQHAFRWTCCGTSGGMDYGCDHHGTGRFPCSCDFCRMGKPLPDSIYREQSQERMGLTLPRGPDPRSFNPGLAAMAATGRSMFGMDM